MTPPSHTYFTFADGSLGYDCAACGQRCCRGKTFAIDSDELIPLIALRPRLARHVRLGGGGTLVAQNVTDGCWFLGDNGFCDIEVESGRDAKPSTCRLFPFNRVYRIGDVRVVDFNSTLCPIEARVGGVTHAEVVKDLDQIGASPLVDSPKPAPPGLAADWWEREIATQALYRQHARDPIAAAVALGDGNAAAQIDGWCVVFGVEPSLLATLLPSVGERVAQLAGSLRFAQLFDGRIASYDDELAALPTRLLGLTMLGALAAEAMGATPSLRALTELWHGQRATLDVLVAWERKVQIKTPQFSADLPAALQPHLGKLLGLGFRGQKTLGEIVLEIAAPLTEAERPLVLALAASQLGSLF